MSFLDRISQYDPATVADQLTAATPADVDRALGRQWLTEEDYLALLSPAAAERLEDLARRAHALTRRQFGNAIVLFTPTYISNYCCNACKYCSFAHHLGIAREQLDADGIRAEAAAIAATGMRHILMLTGEDPGHASIEYLESAVRILGEYFSSIAIEIYPLDEDGYRRLIHAGVDGLTVYQEAYDRGVYKQMHPRGPKSRYEWRIEAMDRAATAGIRQVTVGALLGLADPRSESFFTGLHARYLARTYPGTEVGASFPRLRPLVASFEPPFAVPDRLLVQMLTAFRIWMPEAAITMTTRESRDFRDHVLPLGVTKMSAGVSTAVGGHLHEDAATQFEIDDTRSVEQVQGDLLDLGYQPVMHDWHHDLVERH